MKRFHSFRNAQRITICTMLLCVPVFLVILVLFHDNHVVKNTMDVLSSTGNFSLSIVTLGSVYIASITYLQNQRENRKQHAETLISKYTDRLYRLFDNLQDAKKELRFSCPSADPDRCYKEIEYKEEEALTKMIEVVNLLSNALSDEHFDELLEYDTKELLEDLDTEYFNIHDQNLMVEFGEDLHRRCMRINTVLLLKEYGFTRDVWLEYRTLSDKERYVKALNMFLGKSCHAISRYINCCITIAEMIENAQRYETAINLRRNTTRNMAKTFFSCADLRFLETISAVYQEIEVII